MPPTILRARTIARTRLFAIEELHLSGERFSRGAAASLVVGGALAASSIVLFVLERRRRAEDDRSVQGLNLAPVVGTRAYGVAATLEFR